MSLPLYKTNDEMSILESKRTLSYLLSFLLHERFSYLSPNELMTFICCHDTYNTIICDLMMHTHDKLS